MPLNLARKLGLGLGTFKQDGGSVTPVQPTVFPFDPVTSMFASDCAMGPWYALSTTPPIMKMSDGKVWAGYQGFDWTNGLGLENKVKVYSAGAWGTEYPALLCDSSTDNHGGGAWVETPGPYMHMFGGTHNGPMRHASTATPGDPSTMTRRADIGNLYTYPHPVADAAGMIHLFVRKAINAETRMPLMLIKSTAMASGVPTWGAEKELINFGTDTRYYQGGMVETGTEVHMLATKADFADTVRRNVYYVIYDKTTGTLYNHDKSFSVNAASQPVNLATMNANFRIFDQEGAGTFGQIPSLAIDAAGTKHIAFLDGSGGTRAVKVMSIVAGVIGTPVTVDTVSSNQSSVCLRTMDDGVRLELAYTKENAFTYPGGGGDIWRAERFSNGTWSDLVKIAAATKMYAFGSITPVYKGDDNLSFAFGEVVGTSTTDVENGYILRAYMYGQSAGFKPRASAYHADATAYFAAMTTQETTDVKNRIDAFIKTLVEVKKWDKFEVVHFGALATQQAALIDMTGRHVLSANGSPAFVAGVGFDPDGVDDYINFGFNPSSTSGLRITQTTLSVMAFILDEGQETNALMGTLSATTPSVSLVPRNTSDTATTRLNDGTSLNGANTTAVGFMLAVRNGSTKTLFKNRTQIATASTAATGTVNGNAILFGSGTGRSNKRAPFAAWGTQSFSALSTPAVVNAVVRLLLESGVISADIPD
ncbi:hypothetical protein EVB41_020 [Rhizobium phage RHph_TM3_14A]|nr:hypothetical protein EVB29_020 [Rhizobium phage RHph_TM27A]QIG66940.1 hypothetical protein EVB30_020 [Rhizobium phage RHph_TM27B]QIG67485.1 hypothetical protein EVB41_020 [Rhizobium phage RHph_TM3_14A]